MISTSSAPISESALLEEARVLAVRLAEALAASSMPDNEKEAWGILLPELRLDQLERLAVVLDASVDKAMQSDIAGVMVELRAILEKHAAIQSQLDSEFMSDISAMVQDLRKAELALKE